MFDLPGFPPSLQSFYENSIPWLFYKSYKRRPPEPHLFPDITLKLRRLINVSFYTYFILFLGSAVLR
ncbi:unnamed protein product [Taenia asiatica]|uniref:Uncharacterized protein n=1 Tax=Taenia asiatica TaxID=60517 RepID=A0A0R3VYA9_TAEAS|nr:unnamed protein product [Taenia asiatica]